jgi:tetratricopeptide (TPR) repeat protein
VALPAQADDPAPDVRVQVRELEGRMKAAQAAGDKEAVIEVRRDFAALVERVAGPHHPQLATALDNLAGAYRDRGRLDLAVEPLERALSIREKALGPEHPDTAAILNNLGLALEHAGRHERSEIGRAHV